MTAQDPRNQRAWKRATAEVRRTQSHCHLCGGWIDPHLDGTRDRLAFSVDHLVPLVCGGELLDQANLAAAHRSCNSRRGDRPLTPALYAECRAAMFGVQPTSSRDW